MGALSKREHINYLLSGHRANAETWESCSSWAKRLWSRLTRFISLHCQILTVASQDPVAKMSLFQSIHDIASLWASSKL